MSKVKPCRVQRVRKPNVMETGILLQPHEIRSILAGSQRRIIRPIGKTFATANGSLLARTSLHFKIVDDQEIVRFPYGRAGDNLWVKERWSVVWSAYMLDGAWQIKCLYHADGQAKEIRFHDPGFQNLKTDNPISGRFMPWAVSRMRLRIEGVRLENLQDLEPEKQWQAGVRFNVETGDYENGIKGLKPRLSTRDCFKDMWDHSHAKNGNRWDANPIVFDIQVKMLPE